ncbi:MAG: DUF2391 domain-containing protein [Aquifex sp.]|nr:MAG: DUF2391 domain-containing protein [Aquifex sp.]
MNRDTEKLQNINRKVEELDKKISEIYQDFEKSKKLQRFKFADFVQEFIGALIIALPFSLTEEIWELAEKLSFLRVFFIYLFVVLTIFLFIRYSKLQNWEQQNVFGFIPLRMITSLSISFSVSLTSLVIFGIFPDVISDIDTLLKASLLVSVFAVIGSLGVDMAK